MQNTFMVVASRHGFYVARIGDTRAGYEARASRLARSAEFKRAIRDGVLIPGWEDREATLRRLRPEDADAFGLIESEARALASRLSRARIRNRTRNRVRS